MSIKSMRGAERLQALNVKWFYSWSQNVPDVIPPGMEYVPMIFKGMKETALAKDGQSFRKHGSKYLLGYNEPDNEKQGNMTVEAALDLWPRLMALGLPLIGPSCVHPDNDWMKAFMKGVEERSLRVDYVGVHSYGGPKADAFMQQLENAHELYKRPLWITEFAVGDWKAKTLAENIHSPEQVLAFMKEVLPRLDACDYVSRYAWFNAGVGNVHLASSALFNEDGSLTRLGEAYRSV